MHVLVTVLVKVLMVVVMMLMLLRVLLSVAARREASWQQRSVELARSTSINPHMTSGTCVESVHN